MSWPYVKVRDIIRIGTKISLRFAIPIPTLSTFETLVIDIILNNPWACTDYVIKGTTFDGVTRGSEYYNGKVDFTSTMTGKNLGYINVKGPTGASLTSCISTVLAEEDLETQMGGVSSHDSSGDTFKCAIKCHDANGEFYYVNFYRDKIRITSYEADSIVTVIEAWADLLPALA